MTRSRLARTLGWLGAALLAAGLFLSGWWTARRLDAWLFELRHRDRFAVAIPAGATVDEPVAIPALPPRGAAIGRIEIPEVDVHAMILAGTGERELDRGAGHIPGTAPPGASGNVVLAGHRDTHFRGLRTIRVGQTIRLASPGGLREYRVTETRVVSPDDTEVLNPTATDVLTLITCYPFTFVGAAPERFVVRAEAVEPSSVEATRIASH